MARSTEHCMAMSSGKAWIVCLGLLLGACTYPQGWFSKPNAGKLPTENNVGDVWITRNDGRVHVWNGTQWMDPRVWNGKQWVDAGPSPSEEVLNQQARYLIDQKLQKDEQDLKALKTRCNDIFSNLRIGMRLLDNDPMMTQCAQISYTKTLHKNHEVWSWNDGSGRSAYVDNGVVTTINGTLPSTTKLSGNAIDPP
jgi:hypothetical protein